MEQHCHLVLFDFRDQYRVIAADYWKNNGELFRIKTFTLALRLCKLYFNASFQVSLEILTSVIGSFCAHLLDEYATRADIKFLVGGGADPHPTPG